MIKTLKFLAHKFKKIAQVSVCKVCGVDNPYMDYDPNYICRTCKKREEIWSGKKPDPTKVKHLSDADILNRITSMTNSSIITIKFDDGAYDVRRDHKGEWNGPSGRKYNDPNEVLEDLKRVRERKKQKQKMEKGRLVSVQTNGITHDAAFDDLETWLSDEVLKDPNSKVKIWGPGGSSTSTYVIIEQLPNQSAHDKYKMAINVFGRMSGFVGPYSLHELKDKIRPFVGY